LEKIAASKIILHHLKVKQTASRDGIKEVKKIVKQQGLFVINTYDTQAAHCAYFLKRAIKGIKHIATVYDYYPLYYAKTLKRIWRCHVMKKSERMIFVSHHSLNVLSKYLPITKSSVIYPLFERMDKPLCSLLHDEQSILFVGRLDSLSGCVDLIRAFHLLCPGRTKAKLYIAGSGPQQTELITMVNSLSISDRVEFLGSRIDLDEFFRKSTVFVFPSLKDRMSSVLIQAMNYAKPIVATDLTIHRECLIDNDAALFVKTRDVYNLAMSIKKVLDDYELQGTLGEKARKSFEKRFNQKYLLEKYNALYRMI
ncbi:glycosyltransferase family 4 protein, partial [bacterium]|nr:glycosyltransferase family 4 protein [bacterium]MBU1916546.1 glycosyltransferase family 4 protein [bacterium]